MTTPSFRSAARNLLKYLDNVTISSNRETIVDNKNIFAYTAGFNLAYDVVFK